MDGQCPLSYNKFMNKLGSHEASPVWQLLPIPGHQPASLLTLKKWHQTYPSTFATFHIGFWFFGGFFVFVFFLIFQFLLFLFLFFWLRWVFVAASGLSLIVASRGYSSLQYTGFSPGWLLLLQCMGSRCVGFSSCGTRAQ